ncbi:MAG: hypothetical protein JJT89_17400, partial [Nitriliruptoraceae bacterium]|nr:hypothetical protein [Nitriliruptoraceae bacterium]
AGGGGPRGAPHAITVGAAPCVDHLVTLQPSGASGPAPTAAAITAQALEYGVPGWSMAGWQAGERTTVTGVHAVAADGTTTSLGTAAEGAAFDLIALHVCGTVAAPTPTTPDAATTADTDDGDTGEAAAATAPAPASPATSSAADDAQDGPEPTSATEDEGDRATADDTPDVPVVPDAPDAASHDAAIPDEPEVLGVTLIAEERPDDLADLAAAPTGPQPASGDELAALGALLASDTTEPVRIVTGLLLAMLLATAAVIARRSGGLGATATATTAAGDRDGTTTPR